MTANPIELITLGGYLAILLWIGVRAARQVNSSAEYTLSNRNVPWVIVLATTAATMIGGGASVGMISRVAEVGIAAALVTCAWHLQLMFTGLFVAPKLRGLNLITVGDYFHLKFGPVARELAVINCLIFLVGAVAAQMAAIGTVTYTVLGIPYAWGLFIGATVTVFYSTVGGIRAVIKTDIIQFVILVVGIGSAAALLYARNGGFVGLMEMTSPEHFAATSRWRLTRIVSLFFAFLLGETFVPPYTVRCFVAENPRGARLGVAGAGVFLLLFLPIATFVLGTSALANPKVQEGMDAAKAALIEAAAANGSKLSEEDAMNQSYQIAFPALVRTTFHPVFAGIMIAAIIAAVMSSADSCLSCLSTVVMEDAYRRHINPAATDLQLLRIARWSTLATGVAGALCALLFSNIADILEFVYDFWAPTMVLPFLVGIFWYHRSRIYAVVTSMFAGLISAVVWRFVLQSPYEVGPALFGFGVAVLAYLVAWPFTSRLPVVPMCRPAEP